MKTVRPPEGCKTYIDVTKPPYSVDNTGKTDCTEAINRVIRDFYQGYLDAFQRTVEKLSSQEDPDALITFEIRKIQGRKNVVFPEHLPQPMVVYFPEGEYLVSDTISYYFEEFRNILGDNRNLEMNGMLRFCGESERGTVIRLKDYCPGFGLGADKPVISFMQGRASNIAQSNLLENLTISIGKGNPGATGLLYFANNNGAVRNVTIRSEDPEGLGNTGLAILHDKVSAGYVKNLTVEGFQYGVKVMPQTHFVTFEHITLKHQRRAGFYIGNTVVSIRDLKSENQVTAVWIHGVAAFVLLTDAQLRGGCFTEPAIRYEFGQCLLRNVQSWGYEYTLTPRVTFGSYQGAEYQGAISEYCSHGPISSRDFTEYKTLNLPVEETPEMEWPNPEDWVCVNDFGAMGDGVTDDTDAVRQAMESGKPAVWFQPGRYLLDGKIHIPASVKRVNFMFCDLVSGGHIRKEDQCGVFVVDKESDVPLVLEDLMAWEDFQGHMVLVEHASRRTLVLSDIHCQGAAVYFNTVEGGRVFIENVCCTVGGVPGAGARKEKLKYEDRFDYSRETPCFDFKGQRVYCRLINPERSLHEIVNDGGLLWVLGFKTEEEGTAFTTKNGGKTEVLGGSHCCGLGQPVPLLVNDNSQVSMFSSTCIYGPGSGFPVAVQEIRGGVSLLLKESMFPRRFMDSYTFPPYVGDCTASMKDKGGAE